MSASPSKNKHAPWFDRALQAVVTLYMRLVNRHLDTCPQATTMIGLYSRNEIGRDGPDATFRKVADKTVTGGSSGDTLSQYATMVAGLVSMALRIALCAEEDRPGVELLESLLEPTWTTDQTRQAALAFHSALTASSPLNLPQVRTPWLRSPSFPNVLDWQQAHD